MNTVIPHRDFPRCERVDLDRLEGSRVVVLGLGRFGGGLGAVRALVDLGAMVTVCDRAPRSALQSSVDQLRDAVDGGRVRLLLEQEDPGVLDACDLLVVNPAVPQPWRHPLLVEARRRRIPMTIEVQMGLDALPDATRIVAISGSAGKSTACAMTAHALRVVGVPAITSGNIGGSLLEAAPSMLPGQVVVAELSSAMLWWLQRVPACVCALTSLSVNHLDWHGSESHYFACKRRLFDLCGERALRVLASDCEGLDPGKQAPLRVVREGDGIDALRVPGQHNARNAAIACELSVAIVGEERRSDIVAALRAFPGLAHRLEFVCERGGVSFYNDSKATTPEATMRAIDALGGPTRVHLIAGGYDKGIDLNPVADLAPRLKGLYAIGQTANSLCRHPNAMACGTLERACEAAMERTRPGEIVLLSPACASWDQFENFERRGEAFCEIVRSLGGQA